MMGDIVIVDTLLSFLMGVLELYASFGAAYCSECEIQCIIQNVKKKKVKKTSIDKVIGCLERQQIKRQDKIEKKKKRGRIKES